MPWHGHKFGRPQRNRTQLHGLPPGRPTHVRGSVVAPTFNTSWTGQPPRALPMGSGPWLPGARMPLCVFKLHHNLWLVGKRKEKSTWWRGKSARMNVPHSIRPSNLPLSIKHREATIMPNRVGGGIKWNGRSLLRIKNKKCEEKVEKKTIAY